MSNITETIAEVLRLDELSEDLSPAPWHVSGVDSQDVQDDAGGATADAYCSNDATLIAYYRTAAPAMAREVQRLQAEVQRLQAELTTAHRTWAERCSAWSDGMEEAEASRDAARAEMREAQIGHDCALVAAYESGHRAGQEAMRKRCLQACEDIILFSRSAEGIHLAADMRCMRSHLLQAIRALEVE